MQISRSIVNRNAFVLITLAFLLLTQFSIVRAEGYQLSQNLQPNQILSPNYQLSPDGKYVVYQVFTNDDSGSQGSQPFSVDAATKSRKALTPLVIGNGKFIGSFVISPNSQTVVFNASLESDALNRSESYSIAIAAANPNLRKNIVKIPATSQANIYEFSVSPDSLQVIFGYSLTDGSCCGNNLYAKAITGGTPPPFATKADDQFYQSSLRFAADGRRVIYTKSVYDEFADPTLSSIWAANVPQ